MCGIAGIIALDHVALGKKDLVRLDTMLGCMYHRGPDGEGRKLFSSSVFGMRRLAIIDLEGGQQPICNETEDVWVIMNGEIYNYVELREELLKKGHVFHTLSDTEVLVHLYEEYGSDFVLKLNGMFAIYLYDERKNSHFLFRDHLGIKPLYYCNINNRFYFSSDLTGLRKVVEAKISKNGICGYLGLSYIAKPFTIFDNIFKLSPGSGIKISDKKPPEFFRYWNLNITLNNEISYEDSKEHMLKLLVESNRIQLRSDADVAISLSGGLDSSMVLALASQSYNKTFDTISMSYSGKLNSNDQQSAELMAKKYNTNHRSIELSSEQYFEYIDEVIKMVDEPIADSAIIPNYIISKEARINGNKVLLSGAGGDELFGGYLRHKLPSYLSLRGLNRYPSFIRSAGFNILDLLQPNKNNQKLKHHELSFASAINGLNYSYIKKITRPEFYNNIINLTLTHYDDISKNSFNYEKSRMLNDTRNYLVDNILSLSDKSSMATSIEGRFPIIDYRIVEFASSLPNSYLMHGGFQKGMLKDMAQSFLPSHIINRNKEGYNAPMDQWIGQKKLVDIQDYILSNVKEKLSDIICPINLKESFSNHQTHKNSFENVYNLYFFNKWLDCNE